MAYSLRFHGTSQQLLVSRLFTARAARCYRRPLLVGAFSHFEPVAGNLSTKALGIAATDIPGAFRRVTADSDFFRHSSRCYSTMSRDVETDPGTKNNEDWKIKMLYDGDCPLCMREVNMLRERNEKYRAIKFVDICADDYSAEDNNNIDFEEAMGRIHAIRENGEVLTNIAAFRALYEEVGLGWVYAISNYEPWASILDRVYEFWAKYRLPITGRPPLAEVLEKRRQRKMEDGTRSADARCRVD